MVEQTTLWNGVAGNAWTESQALLDDIYRPFEDLLIREVSAGHVGSVLDLGCGTGATTVAAARMVADNERCAGIDISEPMLAAARARAAKDGSAAQFIQGDAQTHAFDPGSFDTIISRFGVMFFADPVSAFANLRRAAHDNARLRMIVWRSAADNPFMTAAEHAARPILPDLPPRDPSAPGQFAFADPEKVQRILADGGWSEIDTQPIDVVCRFPEKELIGYFTRFGPLGQIVPNADEATRARVIEAVCPAFDRYVRGDMVEFTAACRMVRATAI